MLQRIINKNNSNSTDSMSYCRKITGLGFGRPDFYPQFQICSCAFQQSLSFTQLVNYFGNSPLHFQVSNISQALDHSDFRLRRETRAAWLQVDPEIQPHSPQQVEQLRFYSRVTATIKCLSFLYFQLQCKFEILFSIIYVYWQDFQMFENPPT